MNPYRSFPLFVPGSPAIFIENMIARMTKTLSPDILTCYLYGNMIANIKNREWKSMRKKKGSELVLVANRKAAKDPTPEKNNAAWLSNNCLSIHYMYPKYKIPRIEPKHASWFLSKNENKWATTRQNVSSGVSDQARHKPACAAIEASQS